MTAFINPNFSTTHRGAQRVEALADLVSRLGTAVGRAWSAHTAAREARAAARIQSDRDERTWSAAQHDPRLMADLQCAFMRADCQAEARGEPGPQWPAELLSGTTSRSRQMFCSEPASWLEVNQIARSRAKPVPMPSKG